MQEQQCGERAAKVTVAVSEWMDLDEHNDGQRYAVASPSFFCKRHTRPGEFSTSALKRSRRATKSAILGDSSGSFTSAIFSWANSRADMQPPRVGCSEGLGCAFKAMRKRFTMLHGRLECLLHAGVVRDDDKEATVKTIELDDDVYQHIAAHTKEIGESATSILRRLLGIPTARTPGSKWTMNGQPHELAALLTEPMFSGSTTAVARMLRIFKEAHAQRKGDFEKVLEIQGHKRAYFAKSEKEILKSGRSTQPREIEGTGYWVLTNSPTQKKQQMVREVLAVLGYSEGTIQAAVSAIR